MTTKSGKRYRKTNVLRWLNEQPYTWHKQPSAGTISFDCRVYEGQVYQPQFSKRIPPFYSLDECYNATPMTVSQKEAAIRKRERKITKLRNKKRHDLADPEAELSASEIPEEEPFENPGYLDQPKGMRQLMWERGHRHDGMTARALVNAISQLPDFLNEKSVLFTCWTEGGHGTVETTKCHPETVCLHTSCILNTFLTNPTFSVCIVHR